MKKQKLEFKLKNFCPIWGSEFFDKRNKTNVMRGLKGKLYFSYQIISSCAAQIAIIGGYFAFCYGVIEGLKYMTR